MAQISEKVLLDSVNVNQGWQNYQYCPVMVIQVVQFSSGGTKLERFLPKNQRILLNFENWCNGEVSKSALIWLSNFLCQKSSESFSFFFSLKNINLEAHFLLFNTINFKITLFSEMMSNFWNLPMTPILKIQ